MQTAAKPARRARLRSSNRIKCLLCYLCCFALPPLYQAAAMWLVYPYKLAGTAPGIAANLSAAFPWLAGMLSEARAAADIALAGSPQALLEALAARDWQWRAFVLASFGAAWLVTLVLQLAWRATHSKPVMAARATARAVRDYRLTQLAILALNLLIAAALWLIGVRFIEGRVAWDYIAYFPAYALNAAAALLCFRLAAPPVLSGRRAFFKRL